MIETRSAVQPLEQVTPVADETGATRWGNSPLWPFAQLVARRVRRISLKFSAFQSVYQSNVLFDIFHRATWRTRSERESQSAQLEMSPVAKTRRIRFRAACHIALSEFSHSRDEKHQIFD